MTMEKKENVQNPTKKYGREEKQFEKQFPRFKFVKWESSDFLFLIRFFSLLLFPFYRVTRAQVHILPHQPSITPTNQTKPNFLAIFLCITSHRCEESINALELFGRRSFAFLCVQSTNKQRMHECQSFFTKLRIALTLKCFEAYLN